MPAQTLFEHVCEKEIMATDFAKSLIDLIASFIHSFIHSFLPSFIDSLTHSLTCLFLIHSLALLVPNHRQHSAGEFK